MLTKVEILQRYKDCPLREAVASLRRLVFYSKLLCGFFIFFVFGVGLMGAYFVGVISLVSYLFRRMCGCCGVGGVCVGRDMWDVRWVVLL